MPIFEYQCSDCNDSFELLVGPTTRIACPTCDSQRVVKKLSLFATQVKKRNSSIPLCHTGNPGCDLGKCGSGFCGVE